MSVWDSVSYTGAEILVYRLLSLIINMRIWLTEILDYGNDYY